MPQPLSAFEGLPAPGAPRPDDVIRELGDGLVLRRAREADIDAVSRFQEVVHRDPPGFEPQPWIQHWTRELMDGSHPRAAARDWVLVHDVRAGRVASALCLVPMRLRFGGVPFEAGQIELVGTHPAWRRRGLVRALVDEVHARAAGLGHRATLIDGIPWYYRQFGYEMAVEINAHRRIERRDLPREAATGELRLRDATGADAPLLADAYARTGARHRLACERDAAFWRFERARHREGARFRVLRIVESASGEPCAVVAHTAKLIPPGWLVLNWLECLPGVPWSEVLPAVLAALREDGLRLEPGAGDDFLGVLAGLGSEHPVYAALGAKAQPGIEREYALYARVPDLPGFLLHVAPALERHLAASPLAGHTGELALSFYRDGVRLRLEAGKLAGIEPWRPATDERGDLALPDLTFLKLLFGQRSLAELRAAHPDCVAWRPDALPLVEALFPKQGSDPWTAL